MQKIWKGGGVLIHFHKKQKNSGMQLYIGNFQTRKPSREGIWSAAIFICYVSSLFGILYTFPLNLYISYEKWPVYLTAVLYAALLFLRLKKKHTVNTILLAGIPVLILLLYWRELPDQWAVLSDSLSLSGSGSGGDLTAGMMLFAVGCAILLQVLIFKVGAGWVLYFYSIPVILLGPLIGRNPDVIGICLFALYHIGTSLSGNMMSGRKQTYPAFYKKSHMNVAGRGMYFLAAVFFVFLGISVLLTSRHMEQLFEIPVAIEQRIRQTTMEIFHTEPDKGRVSRGNNYPSGQQQLEIIVDEKPQDPIYLRNYIGGTYENSRWEEADDTGFYDRSIRGGSRDRWEYIGRYAFENRQFSLLQYMGDGDLMPFRIEIRRLSNGLSGYYTPYLSRYLNMTEKGYVFSAYTQEQFESIFENTPKEELQWYENRESLYGQFVREQYLDVDRENLPRLTSLCAEKPQQGIDHITSYIVNTLHSMASYTLNPGVIPLGEEIPEYFLFESHRGYCQHFATTAALMFRLYGVPSRYVTGYMAQPDDFEQQSDGAWRAVLEDGDAHAWTEVYADGQGWKVVDATPSAGDESQTSQASTEESSTQAENTAQEDVQEKIDTAQESEHAGIDWLGIIRRVLWVLMILLAVGAAVFLIHFRRKRKLEEIRKLPADELFVRMMELMGMGGCLRGKNGMEEDFAKCLSKEIECITPEEARRLMNLVYRESFGKGHISEKEQEEAYYIYEKAGNFVYPNLKRWRKWYVRYWKCYL